MTNSASVRIESDRLGPKRRGREVLNRADSAWRVIIIDDNPDDRAEVRRLLLSGSNRRYQLVDAETGEVGVRAVLEATDGRPDCVILDYFLPDMEADEGLAALSGPDGVTVCPIVVMTGVGGAEAGREVLRAGANDYIGKSWLTAEGLTRVVENAVERYQLDRELNRRTARLEESETRFRLAAAAAHALVYQFDLATGRVTSCHGLEDLLGFRDGEVEVSPEWWMGRIDPLDLEAFAESFRRVQIDPRDESIVYRMRHKNGRMLWVEGRWGVARDEDGNVTRLVGTIVDVTERKHAEDALRRSLELFHNLVKLSPYGICLTDADLRLREISRGAQAAFPELSSFIGKDLIDTLRAYWPAPYAEKAMERSRHLLETGEPFIALNVVQQRTDTGELSAYDWRSERVMLPDGRYGLACYFYDVSERQRLEEGLRAREHQLQTLADNSPDIICRFNRELRYVFISAAAERVNGWKPESFLGKTYRELGMPTELCDLWDATTLAVFETGQSRTVNYSMETAAGLRHYSARAVPERGAGDEVELVLVVAHDVTDQKNAEEAALRAGDERLRIALAAARAGAWDWDVTTGAVVWSPENYVLYGLDPADGPPLYVNWSGKIHPDDLARAETAVVEALEGEAHEYRAEYRIIHPTQGLRWLLGIGKVEIGPDGEALRMVGINLDITRQKQIEQALADQDRRKDEFLATLAHELRNPLAPIRNGLELLKFAPMLDGAVVVECREMMERQLIHMVRLVDDLLDVSRIGSGKIELKRERLEVATVLKHAIESSRPLIEAGRHEFVIRAPEEPLWLEGDLTRLSQVVGNVLNNAAKYTPVGGRIELSTSVNDSTLSIIVKDNGEGIPREMLSKVFDMFIQVDTSMKRAHGGLGIGLSLVKKMLEMHGGSIEADSPGAGLGSTFTIRLPLACSNRGLPSLESSREAPDEAPIRSSLRILVVDDNKDAARSLARLFRIWGHSVTIAHDGAQAIATASDHPPELVILDIGLPGMDGFDLCRCLQTNPALSATTFVALTGWGTEDDKKKAHDAGFSLHLVKPIAPEQIEILLKQVIDRRELRSKSLA